MKEGIQSEWLGRAAMSKEMEVGMELGTITEANSRQRSAKEIHGDNGGDIAIR